MMTLMKVVARLMVLVTATCFVPLTMKGSSHSKDQSPLHFDTNAAMQSLFGKYDPATETSPSTVPADTNVDLKASGFESGDDILVHPFWTSSFNQGGATKTVLLTYAVPLMKDWKPVVPGDKPFSCHACAPLIGIAIFQWSGAGWKIEAAKTVVGRAGAWGLPPANIRKIKLGPQQIGIEITDIWTGGGTTSISKLIIALNDANITPPLRILIAEDNRGGCEPHRPSDEPPCYRYRKTVTFKPGPNPDYYDLAFVLSGTDYTLDSREVVRHVSGSELFRFAGDQYTCVIKSGSTTNTEETVGSACNKPESKQHSDH